MNYCDIGSYSIVQVDLEWM